MKLTRPALLCSSLFLPLLLRAVVERYEAFVNLDQKADVLRASRNENAKKMKGKMEKEVRDALIEEGKRIKDELASIEVELNEISEQLQQEAQKIPLSVSDVLVYLPLLWM